MSLITGQFLYVQYESLVSIGENTDTFFLLLFKMKSSSTFVTIVLPKENLQLLSFDGKKVVTESVKSILYTIFIPISIHTLYPQIGLDLIT